MLGKSVRMERIMDRSTGRAVIVPLDHGISMGPIEGLVDMRSTIDKVSQGGATAVVLHKGILPVQPPVLWAGHRSHRPPFRQHQAQSPHPNQKVLVTTVEEALKMGADAVSIHVNLGNDYEYADAARLRQVIAASATSGACRSWS